MKLEDFRFEVTRLPGAMPVWHGRVNADGWREACGQVREKGGRLVALWGADNSDLRERLCDARSLDGIVRTADSDSAARRRALSGCLRHFPCREPDAARCVRSHGVERRERGRPPQKWLRHAAWPADVFPAEALRLHADIR